MLWHTALRDAVAFVEAQPAGVPFTVGEVYGDRPRPVYTRLVPPFSPCRAPCAVHCVCVPRTQSNPCGLGVSRRFRPGDDEFEKTCLVRMLVDQNVLHRVASDGPENVASGVGVGA